MHYERWRRHGDPTVVKVGGARTLDQKLWSKIDRDGPGGCWLWLGALDRRGYGRVRLPGFVKAHQATYVLTRGPVPDGLELDHLCRNPSCCNPDHLEPVTHRENCQRAAYRQTHCRAGHLLPDPDPVTGRRVCRPCANARSARHKAKRRGK